MALKEAQVPKNLIPDPPAPAAGRSPRPKAISQLTRHDTWWIQPLITALVLGGFAVYATWRAFENEFFRSGPYLSPFY
jgi:hypothetical protein